MLSEKTPAPDFTLPDKDGTPVTLSSFRGKPVVLYFYSKDNTSGCTRQAQAFAAAYEQIKALGAEVIGVSKDTAASHGKFAEKYALPFLLLADPEKAVHQLYDVIREKNMYGKKVLGTERDTYIIDEDGVIEKAMNKVRPDENAAQVLAYFKERTR